MRWIEVERASGLNGTVKIPGSKNSSLALLAAACLSDEPVRLIGIPEIADFKVMCEIAEDIGIQMYRESSGEVYIDPRHIQAASIDPHKAAMFRTSYYFVGALLAKCGKVTVGYPGGDDFVKRPIDQHFKALKSLGASVAHYQHHYEVKAKELKGSDVYFDMITSGATINSILAAVRAKGQTVLRNAAKDPEVVDTAILLNQMGARISGAGTDTIRIEGVRYLRGCTYTVIPDRLIAGSFLISAGMTGGAVTVEDVIPEHLNSCIAKLKEIGLHIETSANAVTAYSTGALRATRVRTAMYPGFATDLQQPLTALLTQAPGKSIISDRIYPQRFNHVYQLRRMGANIDLRAGTAFVKGGAPLRGNLVHATDIRAGICLLLAGLAAEGRTSITGIQHFERGYENIVEAFRSLGANIGEHDSNDGHMELLQVTRS
ncbi:UDP-N-acetylglucosamine 1-carboxyvinyltransferase [Paenibacillus mendelii]|uniref:UDP-N-acetylglucosamine 1-carboxyvinyltransferase n=1 Tax=Paenibacillus mendelii TaxID=206163 RepID=A0ABV6J315_9BACL|nr:UDP-N-acetylglucosamine 1-carboxyvinyltransferase [Paenibacillus mendelii]MCQ6559235.1 UDP-N-acetylglucosamine 1-carboxyvinyltransferase [Paenibacillus mendelii]